MENSDQSRRNFIITLITAVGSVGLLLRYLTPRQHAKRNSVVQVSVNDIPSGGALVYRAERIALVRDGDSVAALSLVCTHLGCTVTVSADGLVCPCHGSRFDRRGDVLQGPADRPLVRLITEQANGVLEVYRS